MLWFQSAMGATSICSSRRSLPAAVRESCQVSLAGCIIGLVSPYIEKISANRSGPDPGALTVAPPGKTGCIRS